MPILQIYRSSTGQSGKSVMGVKIENQPVIPMHSSPPTMTGTPAVWSNTQTARPGRKPIVTASAPGLRTLRMEQTVQSPNPTLSIEHLIAPFHALSESGKKIQFIGGGMLAAGTWWRVQDLSLEVVEKARDGRISRVILTWDLIEANDVKSIELTKTGIKPGTVTRIPARGVR